MNILNKITDRYVSIIKYLFLIYLILIFTVLCAGTFNICRYDDINIYLLNINEYIKGNFNSDITLSTNISNNYIAFLLLSFSSFIESFVLVNIYFLFVLPLMFNTTDDKIINLIYTVFLLVVFYDNFFEGYRHIYKYVDKYFKMSIILVINERKINKKINFRYVLLHYMAIYDIIGIVL